MPTILYVVDSSISQKGKEKKDHGTSSCSYRGIRRKWMNPSFVPVVLNWEHDQLGCSATYWDSVIDVRTN